MEREKIIFFRNFFLRAFAVGVLFALFYWVVTLTLWNSYAPWLTQWFKVDEKELSALTLELFRKPAGSARVFLSCPSTGVALEREESLSLRLAVVKALGAYRALTRACPTSLPLCFAADTAALQEIVSWREQRANRQVPLK